MKMSILCTHWEELGCVLPPWIDADFSGSMGLRLYLLSVKSASSLTAWIPPSSSPHHAHEKVAIPIEFDLRATDLALSISEHDGIPAEVSCVDASPTGYSWRCSTALITRDNASMP